MSGQILKGFKNMVFESFRMWILRGYKRMMEVNKYASMSIMNLDQTPLKYIPVSHHTLAKKGNKSVAIAGSSDKRSITGTFTITLDGKFLPLQLIYGGKTKQSLLRYKFPEERDCLNKPNQPALLILDVFRGQMTKDVTDLLLQNKIFFVKVPNNMTQLFQPLDLTANEEEIC